MNVIEMYNKGDVVRVQRGELIVQGPVVKDVVNPYIDLGPNAWLDLVDAIADGWTIEIVKRAPIPVPTKPGIYRDNEGDFWTLEVTGGTENWTVWADPEETTPPTAYTLIRLEEVE